MAPRLLLYNDMPYTKFRFRVFVLATALFAVLALLAGGCRNKAVTLQILHVNDLHSNFEYGSTRDKGGYAQVKTTIDALKSSTTANGQQVLVLNGGDSFEGSPYYFADKGAQSLKLVSAMGFDANVIGNHDFLMGPQDLDALMAQAPAGFVFLGANVDYDHSRYPNLARVLKPYVELTRGDLKIAIIGLVTNSLFYSWAARDISITNPILKTQELVAQLKLRNDIIIVLSHLGTADDARLVETTAGIDLVVGAHDHIPLAQPLFKRNLLGKNVPILQDQPFGEAIGQLTITIKPDRTYTIDGYKQNAVYNTGAKDNTITQLIQQANSRLEQQFGATTLNEVLGTSNIALQNDEEQDTALGPFTAQAFKDAAHTDLAMDFGIFHGMTHPAGSITRRAIMELYPRMFDFSQHGWTIWTMQIPGAALKQVLEWTLNSEFRYALAGASMTTAIQNGKKAITSLTVNGTAIDPLKIYTVAIPEGIAKGLIEIPVALQRTSSAVIGELSLELDQDLMQVILPLLTDFQDTITDTQIPVWRAIENRVKTVKVIQ